MRSQAVKSGRIVASLALVCGSLFAAGCSESEEAHFHVNMVALQQSDRKSEAAPELPQQIANITTALFGTPDNPHVFPETGLDIRKLQRAAGPVWSDKTGRRQGLYREHCSHCHGISGDGAGPTAAFLNPYPRDYRPGLYKFKSTARAAKPTTEDLRRIVLQGIPGTAMPSFSLLAPDEIDALVEYVKYLSIRGETEIRLIRRVTLEGEDLETTREFLVAGGEDEPAIMQEVADAWKGAAEAVIVPPPVPEGIELAHSVAKGRELFYGQVANCVKCHGNAALGDGQATDPDDWSKDILPADIAVGALPPRNIIPRNLRQGIFRGGRRPVDLYWRVYAGINGTPMPGLDAVVNAPNPVVKPEDIWHIVNYVQSLPYESSGEAASQMTAPPRDHL